MKDNYITKLVKKASAWLQDKKESYRKHDLQYRDKHALELQKENLKKNINQDLFNDPSNKLGLLLGKHPNVRSCAVDIGCGPGWLSGILSKKFIKVIGIDPSAAGLEIAKELHPQNEFPNTEWRQGFAEEIMPTLNLTEPYLFVTGCVLSHLRDKEVIKICAVLKSAPKESILSFNECWGDEWHQIRWHVRTKQWWNEQLPGWELDFHGPEVERPQGAHMGFHGVKVK